MLIGTVKNKLTSFLQTSSFKACNTHSELESMLYPWPSPCAMIIQNLMSKWVNMSKWRSYYSYSWVIRFLLLILMSTWNLITHTHYSWVSLIHDPPWPQHHRLPCAPPALQISLLEMIWTNISQNFATHLTSSCSQMCRYHFTLSIGQNPVENSAGCDDWPPGWCIDTMVLSTEYTRRHHHHTTQHAPPPPLG